MHQLLWISGQWTPRAKNGITSCKSMNASILTTIDYTHYLFIFVNVLNFNMSFVTKKSYFNLFIFQYIIKQTFDKIY
jgi:hypothetical protein